MGASRNGKIVDDWVRRGVRLKRYERIGKPTFTAVFGKPTLAWVSVCVCLCGTAQWNQISLLLVCLSVQLSVPRIFGL